MSEFRLEKAVNLVGLGVSESYQPSLRIIQADPNNNDYNNIGLDEVIMELLTRIRALERDIERLRRND